jgi:hypothetical protein
MLETPFDVIGCRWPQAVEHDGTRWTSEPVWDALLQGAGAVEHGAWVWEQGFVAALFAHRPVHQLPSQRYLCPLRDGLPGGTLGYDYQGNPSGFIAIHFGGLLEKPSDAAALHLAPQLRDRATSGRGRH